MEVLPKLRDGSAFDGTASGLARAIHPERELTRLRDQLEICDSHANRVALAQEFVRLGKYDEAIPLFRRSLTGLYKDDPDALFGLAESCLLSSSCAEARQILDRVMRLHADYKTGECRLLLARILEESNAVEAALTEYESQVGTATGQEAKCRYALLFKKLGQVEKANALFEQVLKAVSRSPRYYRKTQSQWVEIAKRNLAEKPAKETAHPPQG